MKLKEIDNIWNSTDGKIYIEECDVVTEDEGETFYCKTHNLKCVFNEGMFCPKETL